MHAGARVAARIEAEAQRLADRRANVPGEGHLGPPREVVAEDAERLVRVDPPLARGSDRRLALERKPGGVREEVAHRRSGRPRGLVEIEDTLFGRDKHGERGDRLRDRGEADHAADVPVRVAAAVYARDPGGGEP